MKKNIHLQNLKLILRNPLLLFLLIFSSSSAHSQCSYQLACMDSWGDGWNGNSSLNVSVNGVIVGTVNSSNFSGGNNFDLRISDVPTNAIIELDFCRSCSSGGSDWASECSWQLLDPAGQPVPGGAGDDGNRYQSIDLTGTQDPGWGCTGGNTTTPSIAIIGNISGLSGCVGAPTNSDTYQVVVSNGSQVDPEALEIIPPSGIEIRQSGGSWGGDGNPMIIPLAGGALNVTIEAQFTSSTIVGSFSNNIVHNHISFNPASSANASVSGTMDNVCTVLMSDADYTGCSATIKDHAGDSDYDNNRSDELILTPTSGDIQLVFTSFTVEGGNYDYLYIYQDNAQGGWDPVGGTAGKHTTNPGTILSSGPLGKIKLNFTSDGSVTYAGFEADLTCVIPPAVASGSWTSGDGDFTSCPNNATNPEEYTINCADLTGNLTATPPTGFEISLSSGSGYTSGNLTIQQANAEAGEIIYVRMASGTSSPSTGNLSISGGGLSSALTTSLSGTISGALNAGTLSGTQSACMGTTVTFSSNGDVGTWTSGTTGVATIDASTGVITPVSTGTSTITYTVSGGGGGCSDATATRDVTVNSLPTASAGSDVSYCTGSSSSIGASASSGHTYSWSPTTGLSSSTNAQPTVSSTSTQTYTLTVTKTSTGCTNTDDVVVTVGAIPTTPDAGSDITVNMGQSIDMAATTNLPTTDLSTSTFSGLTSDWYQLASPYDDFDFSITNSGTPSSGTGPQGSVGANGSTGYVFTESSYPRVSGDIAMIYKTFDLTNNSTATMNFYYYMYATTTNIGPGTLDIEVYTSSDLGASWSGPTTLFTNSSSDNSWVNQSIDLTPYCGNGSDMWAQIYLKSTILGWRSDISIDEIVISGTETATIAWTGPNGYSSSTEDPQVTSSADATHDGDYTITVTNQYGCTSLSDVVNVTVNTPVITTSGTLSAFSACDGVNSSEQSFTVSGQYLTNDITVEAPSGYEISTTSGASFASSLTLTPSSYTVNSTPIYVRTTTAASDGDGGNITCESTNASTQTVATGSATITNNVTPSVSIASDDGDNTICDGTSVTFTATPTNGGSPTYQWFSGGSAISGETSSTYSTSGLTDGESITVKMTADNTCQTASTATSNAIATTVTAIVTPSVSIASDDADNTICDGTSVTFTATPTNGGSSPTYQWYNTGSAIGGATSSTYSTSSLTDNAAIACIMTANNTCQSSATANSNAIATQVDAASVGGSVSGGTTICAGTSLTHTLSGHTGNISNWEYNIAVSGGSYTGWTTLSAAGTNSSYSPNYAAAYDMKLRVVVQNGVCPSTYSSEALVSSVSQPDAGALSGTTSICDDGTTTLSSDGDSGGAWSSATTGVATIDASSGVVTAVSAGTSVITYTASKPHTNCNDATATETVTVTATVTPSVTIASSDADNSFCSGTSVTFTATPTNGGSPNYQWYNTGSAIGGATSSTYTTSGLSNNDVIACTITAGNSCQSTNTANSNAIANTVTTVTAGTIASSVDGGTTYGTSLNTRQVGNDIYWDYTGSDFNSFEYSWDNGSTWNTNFITTDPGSWGSGQTAGADGTLSIRAKAMCGTSVDYSNTVQTDWLYNYGGNGNGQTSAITAALSGTPSTVSSGGDMRIDQTISWSKPTTSFESSNYTWEYEWNNDGNWNSNWQTGTNPATWSDNAGSFVSSGDAVLAVRTKHYGSGNDSYSAEYSVTLKKPVVATSGTLSAFTNCAGTASSSQSFDVSGTYLGSDLTVTAPTGFEVCATAGGSYSSSITFAPTNGTLSSTPVYVRIAAGTSAGSPSGNVECSATAATTVNVSASGTATAEPNAGTLSGTQSVCSNGSTTFSSNGDAGGAFTSGTTGVATVNSSTGVISPQSAGTSTITYTVSGSGGCSDATSTLDVTVTTAPNAGTLSGTQAVCLGGSTTFSSNGDAGGAFTSGTTGVATVNSSTGVISPVAAGSSTITYTVSGSGGCSDATSTLDVTVNSLPTADAGSDATICNGSSTTLGASGGTFYSWSPSTGLSASNVAAPTASSTSTTTYTVTATDDNGCTNTDDVVITVDDAPGWANFQHASSDAICLGGDVTTYGQVWKDGTTPTGNGSGFTVDVGYSTSNSNPSGWSDWVSASHNASVGNNDEFSATLTNASHLSSAGTYYLAFRYTIGACTVYGGTGGLWNNDNQSVTVTTAPVAGTISGTNSVNPTGTSQLSISGNSSSGSWSSGDANVATVSSGGLVTGVAAGSVTITYTVSGTGGCSDASTTYTITVTDGYVTSGSGGDWSSTDTWSGNVVPPADADVTISHDVNVDINTNDVNDITIDNGATLTIGAYILEASGTVDVNGTLTIGASSIANIDGTYDASGGNTTFTGSGTLKLGGTVTSLGTFSKATDCTVEYDGVNQTVFELDGSPVSSSYYNLTINGSGTKTLDGSSKIYGDLALTASDFDLAGNTIYPKNNITRSSGNLIASSASSVTFDNSGGHNVCAFNDDDITLRTTSTGGSVTTTGDITCKKIDLGSGSKTFIIDGQTVNVETEIELTAGTLQLTSGALNINSNSGTSAEINGGTLDLDGGTLTVGNSSSGDITMSSGTIDVAGGTLNIADELDVSNGTITQTGGTINIKSYVGGGDGSSSSKFDMDAGTLNLTAGTLRINGQIDDGTAAPLNPAMDIASGVTVNANLNHTTLIQSNNTSSNDEDIYIDMNGNDLGALTINLSGHEVYLQSNTSAVGALTVTAGTLDLSTHTASVTGTTDIDGVLTMSTGTYDANGAFDATGGTVTFTGSGQLNIAGSITDLGTFTESTGKVVLDGSSAQTLPESETFYNLQVSNSAGVGLDNNVDVVVNGTLTLGNGDLTVESGETLTVVSSTSGGSNSGHIVGSVKYSSSSTAECQLDVGDGSEWHPVKIEAVSNTATVYTTTWTVGGPGPDGTTGTNGIDYSTYTEGQNIHTASGLTNVNNEYYFDIDRDVATNAYISIPLYGVNAACKPNELCLAHYDEANNRWEKVARTNTPSNGNGTPFTTSDFVTGLATSFSPFGGGGEGGDALSIDLVSFSGVCADGEVELEFVVASQTNNDYFTIERSSDAQEWVTLGQIQGVGNTTAQMNYIWYDDSPLAGASYYQLSQTDYDGTSEVFHPIAVECSVDPESDYVVYPNPVNESLMIDLELDYYQGEDINVTLIDLKGSIVKTQPIVLERGFNHIEINVDDLPMGVYTLRFNNTIHYLKEKRIVKQ